MPTPPYIPPAAQNRALGLATLAFAVCFAVWTIFSIIGIQIKQDLGLSDTQFGFLVAVPALTGSISRLPLGIWTEQYGARVVFPLQMLTTAFAVWALSWATSYTMFLVAALGLGLAGGSFIIGVSYVSRWFSAGKQGTALGIFGVGNIGAAVTSFVAPFLLLELGWQNTARVYAVGLIAVAVLFYMAAPRTPGHPARQNAPRPGLRQQLAPLRNLQVWRFSLYYFFVFGGFVALAAFLPRFYVGAYGLELTTAGVLTGLFALPGAVFRAAGGWLSDRNGGRKVLFWTFGLSFVALAFMAYPGGRLELRGIGAPVTFSLAVPIWFFVAQTMVLGFAMSLGSAAVFKHVPAYYPRNVGAVGGLVGMIGGLGGFFLPIAFGVLLDATGIWTAPFILLFLLVAGLTIWMQMAIRGLDRQNINTGAVHVK